jgi:hypothetical protein
MSKMCLGANGNRRPERSICANKDVAVLPNKPVGHDTVETAALALISGPCRFVNPSLDAFLKTFSAGNADAVTRRRIEG